MKADGLYTPASAALAVRSEGDWSKRLCLIGDFGAKNNRLVIAYPDNTTPSYWAAVRTPFHTVSVDMVRYKLSLANGTRLHESAVTSAVSPELAAVYTKPGGPGSYRFLYTYDVGGATVAVGLGLNGPSGKTDMDSGFVEFNPNKCALTMGLWRLLDRLRPYVRRAEVARWDLAMDVPTRRERLRLKKDRRHYATEQGRVLTEYLGRRNSPGRVKLYDKAAELGLARPLARLELTVSGEWDAYDTVVKHWPVVSSWDVSTGPLDPRAAAFVGLARAHLDAGGEIESYLAPIRSRDRSRLRTAILAENPPAWWFMPEVWEVDSEKPSYWRGPELYKAVRNTEVNWALHVVDWLRRRLCSD